MHTPVHLRTPRSLYVHVPFCQHRCGYCDFALVADRQDLVPRYLDAIGREMSGLGSGIELDTIYFGGGTPTELTIPQLEQLFTTLDQHFQLVDGGEWTVEANPNNIDERTGHFLRSAGVSRLSLGVQAFDSDKLRRLDRQHTTDDVARAIDCARQFSSFSIDLIFAAPGESLAEWDREVNAALGARPPHISTYGLTYEPGTGFHTALRQQRMQEVEEGQQREMYLRVIERLTEAGYQHYEVSSFALPGHRSRHNQVYWSGQPYFGLGPGAASYVDGNRRLNHRSTTRYLDLVLSGESPVVEDVAMDDEQRARDDLVFGLRRIDGISMVQFQQRHGVDPCALGGAPLSAFLQKGWLTIDDGWLKLTRAGLLISDSMWPELIVS